MILKLPPLLQHIFFYSFRPCISGILPSDEGRDALNEERKRKRQDEYTAYVQRQREDGGFGESRSRSVSELRRELAHKRNKELYRNDNYDRREKEKEWAEEEKGLMKWMREKGKTRGGQESLQPDPRSFSAPVPPGGWTFGTREETLEEKKEKQSRYRSELIEQMKEKEQLKERNGRDPPRNRRHRPPSFFDEDPKHSNDTKPVPSRREREHSPPMHNHRFRPSNRDENYESHYPRRDSAYYNRHHHYPPAPPYHDHAPYPGHAPYYYPPYPAYHHVREHYPHPPPPPPPHGYPPDPAGLYREDYYYHPPPRSRRGRSPRRRDKSRSPSPEEEERREEEEEGRRRRERSLRIKESAREPFKAILKKKEKEKRDRENFIKRMEDDTYDPWGRPGGGAPLMDASGNVVTERGLLRKSFDELSPRMTEEEKKKLQQEKQKEELMRQINEKEQQKLKEKLEKQQEDERDERRIREEMDRLHLQSKKEREKEKERAELSIETKQKPAVQEEPITLLSKQEMAEKRLREEIEKQKRKKQEEQERLDRLADKMAGSYTDYTYHHHRQSSPPIPTLNKPPKSPPIPTLRKDKPPEENQVPPPAPPDNNSATHINSKHSVTIPPSSPPPSQPIPVAQYDTHALPSQAPPIYHTYDEPLITPSPDIVRLPVETREESNATEVKQTLSLLKDQLRRNLSEHHRVINNPQRNEPFNSHISSHYNPQYQFIHSQAAPQSHSQATQPHSQAPQSHSQAPQPHSYSHAPPMMRPSIPKPPPPHQQQQPAPSSETVSAFNRIKYAAPTSSRLSFWKQYPEPPKTNNELEMQQEALLYHQRQHRESK